MNRILLTLCLACFACLTACERAIERPKAYLETLLADAEVFHEGCFGFRLNLLPPDYFLARELAALEAAGRIADRDSLKESLAGQYGNGDYYLLRIALDSAYQDDASAKAELTEKMLVFQARQELVRGEITGHLENGDEVHPDLFMANSDWIARSGSTLLFSFRKDMPSRLLRIEFGKSFVYNGNRSVEVRALAPNFRLKG